MKTSIAIVAVPLASCASILAPGPDLIAVSTEPPGAGVTVGGNYIGKTPLTLSMPRKGYTGDEIVFALHGYDERKVKIASGVNGAVFGNLLFGGVLGFIVDGVSGNSSRWSTDPIHVVLSPAGEAPTLSMHQEAVQDAHEALVASAKTNEAEKRAVEVHRMTSAQILDRVRYWHGVEIADDDEAELIIAYAAAKSAAESEDERLDAAERVAAGSDRAAVQSAREAAAGDYERQQRFKEIAELAETNPDEAMRKLRYWRRSGVAGSDEIKLLHAAVNSIRSR